MRLPSLARRFGPTLSLVTLGHFALELCNNCMPVVYPLLVTAGRLTLTQVGTITLVASMAASLTQPIFGHISDRWDARKIASLAVALSAVSIAAVGMPHQWLLLALCVVLAMVGSAAFHPSGATLAAASVRTARTTAVSIFSLGGTVGAAFSPLLVAASIGWFDDPRGTAIVLPTGLASAALIYALLHRPGAPNVQKAAASTRTGERSNRAVAGLAVIIASTLFRMWVQVSLATYLPTWVQEEGRPLEASAGMLFAMTVGTGLGSIVGGTLADRIGRWQLMAIALGLLGPAAWMLLHVPPAFQILPAALVGALIGADYPAAIVAAQETWPGGLGVATGLALGLSWIGAGLGGQVTGMIADATSVAGALRWLIIPAVLSCLCVLMYPLVMRRRA